MRRLTSFLAISLLTACGGSNSGVGSNDELLGTWQSNCYQYFSQFRQKTFIFDNGSYSQDRITYSDASCTMANAATYYSGTYTVGVNVNASDGAEVTRLTMEEIDLDNPERATRTVKSVFRIVGADLYMGEFGENKTAEINPSIIYIKQSDARQVVCTDQVVPGLSVTVKDAAAEEFNACGATVIITDGDYLEEHKNASGESCDDEFVFNLASERKGRYDIIVQKDGYTSWHEDDVIVTANRCHVNTVSMTAELDAKED